MFFSTTGRSVMVFGTLMLPAHNLNASIAFNYFDLAVTGQDSHRFVSINQLLVPLNQQRPQFTIKPISSSASYKLRPVFSSLKTYNKVNTSELPFHYFDRAASVIGVHKFNASHLATLPVRAKKPHFISAPFLQHPIQILTAQLKPKKKLEVTATAYTSHVNQTDSTPNIAAWGDRLTPDMKIVAVSRDLLNEYGLTRGSRISIEGLPGQYMVLDKMNKRWRKKIDIYMGKDLDKAFEWGRQKVTIIWDPSKV